MVRAQDFNPFSKRDQNSDGSVLAYKVLTFVSWLVFLISAIHFAWNAPAGHHNRTIWGQNDLYPTPFSLNHVIVDIYWVVLVILQVAYMYHLYTGEYVNAATNVGAHFIANNLLNFGFIMLWVHTHFWIAELLLVINFFNLTSLYLRHSTAPLLIHVPVVSGPLAWNFVALFWCGAAMVNAQNLIARIFANVAVWGFMAYGLFFLAIYKDYTMGFNLSVLTASLGVHQFLVKIVALQWIFAFTIMAVLFVSSLAVAIPGVFGKEFSFERRNTIAEGDQERQPLLNDE